MTDPQGAQRSVLVIGSTGALGRMTMRCFDEAGWEVHGGARRPDGGERIRWVDLDKPQSLADGFADVDLVVNTVPDPALRAEAAVLAAGGTIFNVAAGPLADGTRLRFVSPDADARGLVVLHGGLVPGVTSLVASDLLREHPDADAVEMVWTLTAQGFSGEGGRLWAHSYVAGRDHHPTFRVPLPPPYGTRRVLRVAEAERAWLTAVPPTVEVRTGLCFLERDTDAGFHVVNALRLMQLVPRRLFTHPPRHLTRGVAPGTGTPPEGSCTYWIAVYRDGRRLAARTIACEDDYLATGVAGVCLGEAIVAHAAASGEVGVRSVEQLMVLDDVRAQLAGHHVHVVER